MSLVQRFPRNRTFNVLVGVAAAKFLSANSRRTKLLIQNLSANNVEIVEAESSAIGTGIRITTNQTFFDDNNVNQGELFLVAAGAASDVRIREEFEELGG